MKYIITLFVVMLLLLNNSETTGQTWAPLGDGVSEGKSGTFVNTLFVFDSKLYVGGDFRFVNADTAYTIAIWDGTSWSRLGNGISQYIYRGTLAISVYNSEVFVGGDFVGENTATVMMWDGNNWASVSSPPVDGFVDALTIYNNELYAGGVGGKANYIAKWDGMQWSEVGGGVNGQVNRMQVYNNELYVAGYFTSAGGVSVMGIAKWNGTDWLSAGFGIEGNNSREVSVQSLTVHKDYLYAGATFTTSVGVQTHFLAKGNGTEWSIIDSSFNNYTLALTSFNNELYAGGKFDSVGGKQFNYIARWNDTTWFPVDGGMNDAVYSLAVFNNELYAGGIFTEAGSVAASRIAKLTSPVGVKEESENLPKDYELYQNYPNPFNPSTKISWQSPIGSWQTLKIFDVLGNEIATLVNEEKPAGEYAVEFNATALPSGVYFYRLRAGNFSETKKMVLIR